MSEPARAGWEQDSPTLYLHASGVRIERRLYKNQDGWYLVPVDLDRSVVRFPPDEMGLELAFADFLRGAGQAPGKAVLKVVEDEEEETDDGEDDGT